MKVSGVNTAANSTKKAETKKGGAGAFASYLGNVDEVESSAASATSEVGGVNSLFMLQEVDDENYSRKKSVKYGSNILDYLDEIRVGLLSGEISPDLVRQLDSMIKKWRENINDPALESIINDIELRAAVEMAKLESL